ncbi:MAG: alpha/beta fold hydrolase [Candidatus Nitrosocosmicus sp.]
MYQNVNGHVIRFDEYGTGNQDHVLFIHGLGTSAIAWRDIPEALSSKYHTIVVDLIGFGGSDKPEYDYTISFFSQFLSDFLDKVGINKDDKIILVGHSLGGYISIDFAIKNKNRVKKMILFDSSGLLNEPTPLLNDYMNAVKIAEPQSRREKLVQVFGSLLANPTRLLLVVVDIFVSVIETKGAKEAFESAFKNSTSSTINAAEAAKLAKIPTLIVWGESDKLIPPSYLDKFKKILPHAQIITIRDSGHSPFVEKPAIVYQKLLDFLS